MPPSPEMQFISDVLSLSLKPDNFQIEENILPVGQTKWDEFMPLVKRHRVGGLLFYWVRKLKLKNSLPPHIFKCLKHVYESFADIWEDHREIIKKILMRFHESEIEIVLLKGAQLGRTDYPNFSLRPMEDIDLLVKGSNKLRIINLMLEMGFNLYHTGETCDKFFIRNKQTGKPIFIEIHSDLQVPIRLDKSFSVDMDEFWNGTQMEYFDGFPFRQLHPTYNLIYLCTHLGEHHFSRLIWAYDIALLIHRHGEEIDWETLTDLCPRMKIRSPLYYSFSLCQELFQIPIPEIVLKDLSPSWWKRRIGHFLMRRNLQRPERSRVNRLTQFLIKMFLVDNWMEAILWFLFPTREWIKQYYSIHGTYEIYPYYLFHPILYLIKAIRAPQR
jgi:hypothetical protein